MNILVLNYEYPPLGGGAAPVSRDISRELKKAGHNVVVVTMGYKELPSHEVDQGVEIYRVRCMRRKLFSCMPWEQLTYLVSIRLFMKKHPELLKFDVCHTHFVIPTGEAARHFYRKYHIPYVITAHGSDVEGYNSKKYMKVMHVFLRRAWKEIVNDAYRVVAPSVFLESLMKKAHNLPDKYVVIPNGIELQRYQSLYKKNGLQKQKTILLMGRMQKYKNFQTAIRALSLIDLKDWKVEVLGDGPYRTELEMLVMELHMERKITFHGWVENNSPKQMELLQASTIYISASLFENCPMAVIETAAAGCHVLLSDIPAHRQLIAEEEHFFAAENEKALAAKIEELIQLTPKPCTYDLSRLDWENVIQRYICILSGAARNQI